MSRTISALMCAAMMGGVPVAAFADHVTLKNGDALTGRISSSSATEIVLETDLIGRVTIAMTSVSDVQRAGATTATAEEFFRLNSA